MHSLTALLAITLLAAPSAPAHAESDGLSGPAPVTLAAVLAYADSHAPALAAARARVDLARQTARTRDPWPEPRLMIGADPLPVETRNGPAWARATLTQPLPWLDGLAAHRRAAEAGTHAAAAGRSLTELRVRFAAEAAYIRLRASRDEARVIGELLDVSRALLRSAEDSLGVQRSRHADVIEARIEMARLETVALDLAQQALTRGAELNAAIGRETRAPFGPLARPEQTPTAELDRLLAAAADHPSLRANAARLDAARARLRAAQTIGRPQFSVGLGYTLVGQPEGGMAPDPGRDALSVQVGMTLPLWGGEAYDGARQAAAAAVRIEEAEAGSAAAVIEWRVVEQAVRAETALRRLTLYRDTALPLADERLEVLVAAYAAGEVSFDRLLDAERAKERYGIAAVRAAEDFALARAALVHAIGRPLDPPTAAPEEAANE